MSERVSEKERRLFKKFYKQRGRKREVKGRQRKRKGERVWIELNGE